MSPPNDLEGVVADPQWLPVHWEAAQRRIDFNFVERSRHPKLTFLSSQYLEPLQLPTASFPSAALSEPLSKHDGIPHYIFHSAFCCSTLLARALDFPGASMALNEPNILIELAAAARNGQLDQQTLSIVVGLLGRAFAEGEHVVVKPGNEVNLLAPLLMDIGPGSRAIFLHAPLERFLRSISGKGMWGRIWARRLFTLMTRDTGLDFGLSSPEQFDLTDLQAAALSWLLQHAQGGALLRRYPDRVRILDSETFLARREETIGAAASHFGLAIDENAARGIAEGATFAKHSKEIGRAFDPEEPLQPKTPIPIIDEEISMVSQWARNIAQQAGIALEFEAGARLLPA